MADTRKMNTTASQIGKKIGLRLILIALSSLIPVSLSANETYVYKERDGTIWFTNIEPKSRDKNKFTLVNVYNRQGTYKSCYGLSLHEQKQRTRPYDRIIDIYAKQHDVNPLLIKSIIWTESCFDQHAVSRVGAQGLMQLMPRTAKILGVKNSFDPIDNIQGGTRYFSQLLKAFGQDKKLALAAYNAGPTAVKKYKGIPPYRETQKYVKRVLKKYNHYLRQ